MTLLPVTFHLLDPRGPDESCPGRADACAGKRLGLPNLDFFYTPQWLLMEGNSLCQVILPKKRIASRLTRASIECMLRANGRGLRIANLHLSSIMHTTSWLLSLVTTAVLLTWSAGNGKLYISWQNGSLSEWDYTLTGQPGGRRLLLQGNNQTKPDEWMEQTPAN
jgi:hypothetical protein